MRKTLNPRLTRLVRLAMLTALACALRLSLANFPNVKPITALFFVLILFGGLADSLVVMSLTMLATGLLLGFSPIIIGQILVYGLLLILFYFLTKLSKNLGFLTVLTGLAALIYGALLDLFSGFLFGFGAGGFLAYWLAGLPFDLAHALSTVLFFPLMILIFGRIKTLLH